MRKIGDWSSITLKTGARGGGEGQVKAPPPPPSPLKVGGGKSFSHPEGGYNKFWSSFNTVASSFNQTEGGKIFPPFKLGVGG